MRALSFCFEAAFNALQGHAFLEQVTNFQEPIYIVKRVEPTVGRASAGHYQTEIFVMPDLPGGQAC